MYARIPGRGFWSRSLVRAGVPGAAAALTLALTLTGCHEQRRPDAPPQPGAAAAPASADAPQLPPGHPPIPALPPDHGQRFVPRLRDGKTGAELTPAALAERLRPARAIYAGEQHNSRASHLAQLFVLREAHALDPRLAVGVEMLPRTHQAPLDDYAAGRIDEAAFLRAVDWEHTWGFDFALYRPLFEFCRTHGLRMHALNAPRDLAKAVRQRGIDGLTAPERAQLPSGHPWPAPAPHRDYVREVFARHGFAAQGSPAEQAAAFERFYAAQLVWDESMAQGVAAILAQPGGPQRVVVLAGSGHVGPYAIPGRAARRGVSPGLTLASLPRASEPSPEGAEAVDVVLVLGPAADPE